MMQSAKKRVFRNTLMLYFRQILVLLVGLYSVRIVLNELGATDYGIYQVVAGIVTMFSFLSTAMASATQRFYSFRLGRNDFEGLKDVFCVVLEIYILLILVVVVLAETVGLWFVKTKLVFPDGRLFASVSVYQFAVLTFVFTLFSTPFMALIIAHEDMSVYSYVSVAEAVLKLAVVFVLKFLLFDKLILYGILLACVSFAMSAIYFMYCVVNYRETKLYLVCDKSIFLEILSFCGWCLFGTGASIAKNQITNVLLNLHFGPTVNAARGIALNVNSAIIGFSNNFNMAVRPQIIKKYSAGDKEETFTLVYQSSKLSFLLLFVFMLPFYLEMETVLSVWLKNPPDMTISFTRLILIEIVFDAFSYPLQSLSQAAGKMKLYQSVVGGVLLLNLPFAYFVLQNGFDAYAVQYIAILIAIFAFVLRIFINSLLTGLSVKTYFIKILFPCLTAGLMAAVIPVVLHAVLGDALVRLLSVSCVSVLSVVFFGLFVCLNKNERKAVFTVIKGKLGSK